MSTKSDVCETAASRYEAMLSRFTERPHGRGNLSKKQVADMVAAFKDGFGTAWDMFASPDGLPLKDP